MFSHERKERGGEAVVLTWRCGRAPQEDAAEAGLCPEKVSEKSLQSWLLFKGMISEGKSLEKLLI